MEETIQQQAIREEQEVLRREQVCRARTLIAEIVHSKDAIEEIKDRIAECQRELKALEFTPPSADDVLGK